MSEQQNESKQQACQPRIETELLDADRRQEVKGTDSWRVFKVLAEFVTGFDLLRKYGKAVTFFGSARCVLGDETYDEARELAAELARRDFAIITGGASGVMEAANRGAFEVGGDSVGINIQLPNEQSTNEYVTDVEHFHYFFTRKVMLSFASEAYVFFPGGFGTLDEFYEMVTLIQTKKIKRVPIVLVGETFWTPLIEWMRTSLLEENKTISPEDLDLFVCVDTVDEAVAAIEKLVDGDVPK